MRLGNSQGNNRGKKYIIRGKHDGKSLEKSRTQANKFSLWFASAYTSLERELKYKTIFDDDVLNETFLRIYENILFAGISIEQYRAYFMRAYFTNYVQGNIRASRFGELPASFDQPDIPDYNHELEMAQKRLEEDIFTYVYQRYNVREFELFKMYVCLKPAVNYATLADLTNMKAHQIQFVISKIKKDICRNSEFAARRRETGC